jgi:hypothetical protein
MKKTYAILLSQQSTFHSEHLSELQSLIRPKLNHLACKSQISLISLYIDQINW